jgi:hypothetical protein
MSQNSLQDSAESGANYPILRSIYLDPQMPLFRVSSGDRMIIFVLTFAIISLFALTLTGSIAATATARRRS